MAAKLITQFPGKPWARSVSVLELFGKHSPILRERHGLFQLYLTNLMKRVEISISFQALLPTERELSTGFHFQNCSSFNCIYFVRLIAYQSDAHMTSNNLVRHRMARVAI